MSIVMRAAREPLLAVAMAVDEPIQDDDEACISTGLVRK
jgi:hypothetical protein